MAEKIRPIGVCDLCGGPIPEGEWYTKKRGTPTLYCSRDCRNTANSRAGLPIIVEKLHERMRSGEWQPPQAIRPLTSEEQRARAKKGRLREVQEGRWRNPALTDKAREKLSRPRKHTGPLHTAMEKLKKGYSMRELTQEEQDAYREYERNRQRLKRESKKEKPDKSSLNGS